MFPQGHSKKNWSINQENDFKIAWKAAMKKMRVRMARLSTVALIEIFIFLLVFFVLKIFGSSQIGAYLLVAMLPFMMSFILYRLFHRYRNQNIEILKIRPKKVLLSNLYSVFVLIITFLVVFVCATLALVNFNVSDYEMKLFLWTEDGSILPSKVIANSGTLTLPEKVQAKHSHTHSIGGAELVKDEMTGKLQLTNASNSTLQFVDSEKKHKDANTFVFLDPKDSQETDLSVHLGDKVKIKIKPLPTRGKASSKYTTKIYNADGRDKRLTWNREKHAWNLDVSP